ncbi:P-loop containing nucleoside triphosphate hydrolase protein [Pterulicium gracile]|uniref:P-loop containing nucleoside triphosphate hydrolase protein n=1 Tax=Pterulicium gracile TaxID=1884261 RepID=A0A5C3QU65_9AGAR|nr:P-loop containing nucleoside triphosphate hydrolase protein [Pterula gracilis]
MKFPDRTTPIGKMIDAYLRSESEMDDRAIHLLFSANRWEAASSIENLLNAGTAVIADRYAFSGIAFTLSKPFICPPPDSSTSTSSFATAASTPSTSSPTTPAFSSFAQAYKWAQTPDISLPSPDLTVFLDVSPEVARERAAYGVERYENEELQRRVRRTFEEIGRTFDDTAPAEGKSNRWVVVDAGNDLGSVEKDVWRAVEGVLKRDLGEVGRLWANKLC